MTVGPLNHEVLALNLSYVLNEPSGSRDVQRAARVSNRFVRHRNQRSRQFTALSEEQLRSCIVVPPNLQSEINHTPVIEKAVTAMVGLPDLLPRALALFVSGSETIQITNIDLEVPQHDETASFFTHPAAVPVPPVDPVFAGGLVLMPDEQTLLLSGSVSRSPLRALEDLVRDFCEQWTPPRTLWSVPLEIADPNVRVPARTSGEG